MRSPPCPSANILSCASPSSPEPCCRPARSISSASDVRAMSDGKIYASGGINYGYPNDLDEYMVQDAIVRRLNPDGTPDLTFDGDSVASRRARFCAGAAMTSTLADDGTATIVAGAIHRFVRLPHHHARRAGGAANLHECGYSSRCDAGWREFQAARSRRNLGA